MQEKKLVQLFKSSYIIRPTKAIYRKGNILKLKYQIKTIIKVEIKKVLFPNNYY